MKVLKLCMNLLKVLVIRDSVTYIYIIYEIARYYQLQFYKDLQEGILILHLYLSRSYFCARTYKQCHSFAKTCDC